MDHGASGLLRRRLARKASRALSACLLALLAAAAAAQESGPVRKRPPESPAVPIPAPPVRPVPEPESDPAAPAPVPVFDPMRLGALFAGYRIVDGRAIPEPLGGHEGDVRAGRRLYHNAARTGCSLCHGTAEHAAGGGEAPSLWRAGERLTAPRIRLWIVAPETVRPGTAMPAFHKPGQRTDPSDPLYGGPRLSAAEVEDLVAYLTRTGPPADIEVSHPGDPDGYKTEGGRTGSPAGGNDDDTARGAAAGGERRTEWKSESSGPSWGG